MSSSSSQCPVCYEPFNDNDRIPQILHSSHGKNTHVNHTLCSHCIGQVVGKIRCPLCNLSFPIPHYGFSVDTQPLSIQLCEDCEENGVIREEQVVGSSQCLYHYGLAFFNSLSSLLSHFSSVIRELFTVLKDLSRSPAFYISTLQFIISVVAFLGLFVIFSIITFCFLFYSNPQEILTEMRNLPNDNFVQRISLVQLKYATLPPSYDEVSDDMIELKSYRPWSATPLDPRQLR